MLLTGHAARQLRFLGGDLRGVDLVGCQVVGQDVVARVAGDAQGACAQHARAVLAVLAVHKGWRAGGCDGAQHGADEGIVAGVAAVVGAHALLGGAVLADDAVHEAGVCVALLASVARLHGEHAHARQARLGGGRHLARAAHVVDRPHAQHVHERDGLLRRDAAQLARAEERRALQVARAHGPQRHAAPDLRGPALGAGRQHVERERLHGGRRLARARERPRAQLVAPRRGRRVGEAPAHTQLRARPLAGKVRPGGAAVQRQLHGRHAVGEVVDVPRKAYGFAHIVEAR